METKATIAIACDSANGLAGEVSGHFGHTPFFVVAKLGEGKVLSSNIVASPGHGQGCSMPGFVAQLGAAVVLVGGIGPGAINGLAGHGIEVVAGVTGNAGAAAEAFAKGSLITGEPSCHGGHAHGHDGGCGHHHH
jgi:predicted Fe-Mo cluster-binding NifX family protein